VPKKHTPPPPKLATPQPSAGILELERFNEASLTKWLNISRDLDQLADELFFSVRPDQNRLRDSLLEALRSVPSCAFTFQNWSRIVSYRYSLQPLSCAGSMLTIGGRFNPGAELDAETMAPFPALYVATDYKTAFREKFQIAPATTVDGLSPHELALQPNASHSTVLLVGKVHHVFDMTAKNLEPVASIFRKIKMPPRAQALKKKLGTRNLKMITTAADLYRTALDFNWRQSPVQFGLPAQSQILAELIRAAGFEGVYYKSSKGPGHCLALFPDRLQDTTYLQLADAAPAELKYTRLDFESAPALAGYDQLPSQARKLLMNPGSIGGTP
jgi:RES domain